jgi:hypothetical protein
MKRHIVKRHRPSNPRQLQPAPLRILLGLEVQDAKDPFCRGQGLLNRIIGTGQSAKRRIGHEHRRQK